jgi:hypothetical protein
MLYKPFFSTTDLPVPLQWRQNATHATELHKQNLMSQFQIRKTAG